ncbi:PREDICTED: ATP synthase subunit s-like protein [Habropoda laboriosa]|uniref:ATP synthase subunit s-like protein n=1 Tax=Habropoda laboriosa TaxID=597456 RepID=UPI00083D1EE3|nr:PREDICTED: ATP synthase subunit s-like protein [Habropoda laboriosa]
MLLQRYTHINKFKQILECRTVCNSLQINVTRSFYNNYEAINHFIRYLRKRHVIVGTEPIKDVNQRKGIAPKKLLFKTDVPNLYDFTTFNLKHWWRHKKDQWAQLYEDYQYKQYVRLGPDLAAAKFVIEYDGKVKFKNHSEWLDKSKEREISELPNEYDATYILEELDLNGYPLRYKHLHFIFDLYYLRKLSFRGCNTIDDWALDKISAEYPTLEHLDISECENVTERGLEALYRMPNLKKLTVTNFYGSAAFDLTCFMLEDVNPYLTCEVQQVKYKCIPAK